MPEKPPKYAPAREDGLYPYVVTKRQWGNAYTRIEWCATLRLAKSLHGWTRELHTYIDVRRATPADLEAYNR